LRDFVIAAQNGGNQNDMNQPASQGHPVDSARCAANFASMAATSSKTKTETEQGEEYETSHHRGRVWPARRARIGAEHQEERAYGTPGDDGIDKQYMQQAIGMKLHNAFYTGRTFAAQLNDSF
jgi:hypothetical protein